MYRVLFLFTLMIITIFIWYNFSSKVVGFIYNPLTSAENYLAEGKTELYLIPANVAGDLENIFRNFSARGAKFVIGPSTSADGKSVLPYLEKYNMISLSPTISSPRLLKTGYVYSLTPSNEAVVSAFEKYLSKIGCERLLVVLDDGNREYADDFKRLLDIFSGDFVYYKSQDSLSDVNLQEYDTAVITTFDKQSADVVKYLKLKNSNIKCVVSEAAFNKNFLSIGGQFVEGTYLIAPFTNIGNTEIELLDMWTKILTSHRFISVQQFKRFVSSTVIQLKDNYFYFGPDGVNQKIGLYIVENGQFKEVQ